MLTRGTVLLNGISDFLKYGNQKVWVLFQQSYPETQ